MTVPLDIETAQNELGFGLYQLRSLALILLPMLVNAMHNSNYIFAAADLDYRCKIPECESEPPQYLPGDWVDWALPPGDAARCNRYIPTTSTLRQSVDGSSLTNGSSMTNGSSLTNGSSVTNDITTSELIDSIFRADSSNTCTPQSFIKETKRCNAWIYGSNESIVAEFNLACQDWKRTLVGTMHSSGMFVALIFIGLLSDRFGRRPVFLMTACSPAITGLARALCKSYPWYIALEFIEALLGAGVYTTGCVLVMETMTAERRVLTSTLLPISYSLGHVVLAAAAWALPGWRSLLLAIYLPSTLFFSYFLLLHESPRWLAARDRTKDAAAILFRAAKINGVTFSPKVLQQLNEDPKSVPNSEVSPEKNKTSIPSQVLHSKLLMCRLAICGFWWITCALVFYGLSINSVSLAGNKYVNFMLTSIAEIPGYTMTVVALDRFGRRVCLRTAYLLCGVSLISLPLIPSHMGGVLLTLTLIGKVWISMAFGNLYVYTSELFPTQARHSMLAACSMIGRIGQILAPQTPLLMALWRPLPYVTFGGVAVVASLLTLLAPETRRTPLSDTVAQAEEKQTTLTSQ